MRQTLFPALFLTLLGCATPALAQDRVAAFLDLFETWCLSRKEDPGRDWETAYPENGRANSTAFSVNNIPQAFYKRIYDATGLSLAQEKHSCTVSTEEPAFSTEESAAVLDGLSQIVAQRYPGLLREDDTELGWDISRVWTDGPAGTPAATWGIILMRVGDDLPFTTATLALPH